MAGITINADSSGEHHPRNDDPYEYFRSLLGVTPLRRGGDAGGAEAGDGEVGDFGGDGAAGDEFSQGAFITGA